MQEINTQNNRATRFSTTTKLWNTSSSPNLTGTWMWSTIGKSSPDAVTSHTRFTAGTHSTWLAQPLNTRLVTSDMDDSKSNIISTATPPSIFPKVSDIMLTSGTVLTVSRGSCCLWQMPLGRFPDDNSLQCVWANHMYNSDHGMDSLAEGARYAYSGNTVSSHTADGQE